MTSIVALIFGFAVAALVPTLLGENPVDVFHILYLGALGSKTQFGYSLFYATPLIFTGLSVAWAGKAGLFNIGAEGQMTMGGLAAVTVGILAPDLPTFWGLLLAVVAAFLLAGLWGAMAGWMKAYRGCNEVLTTILLNFVAYGVTAYFILHVFKNPNSQNPETLPVAEAYQLHMIRWLGGVSPLNIIFFVALVVAAIFAFVFAKTKFGFRQRLVGGSPEAALRSGIHVQRQQVLALFIAGGLAGLASLSPLLGSMTKLREGSAGGLGFVGIAVALLGRQKAFGVIISAFLFGALMKGALDLEIDTVAITRDLSIVIQAIIILTVASQKGLLGRYAH
jgi:simple sugar transport system permease protein